jgi:hypothetical protein
MCNVEKSQNFQAGKGLKLFGMLYVIWYIGMEKKVIQDYRIQHSVCFLIFCFQLGEL